MLNYKKFLKKSTKQPVTHNLFTHYNWTIWDSW